MPVHGWVVWLLVGLGGSLGYALPQVAAPGLTCSLPVGPVARYHLTDMGTLPGRTASFAASINKMGDVVGWASDDKGSCRAFLYKGGRMLDLGTLGGRSSKALYTNDAGEITGWAFDKDGYSLPCFWSRGRICELASGLRSGGASCINKVGQVVGEVGSGHGASHATLWSGGAAKDLGTLGGESSMAVAISDSGIVVGNAETKDGSVHAFLWSDGAMKDLGTLGGPWSGAYAVNRDGKVVGFAQNKVHCRAVAWSGGLIRDLASEKDWPHSMAFGINGAGYIVGYAFRLVPDDEYGRRRGVLWTDEQFVDLTSVLDSSGAGWTIEEAKAINDSDQIAATAYNARTRQRRAVLLTPLGGSAR